MVDGFLRTLLNVIDDSDRVAVAQNHLGERQTEQRSQRQRPMNSFRMNFKIDAMEMSVRSPVFSLMTVRAFMLRMMKATASYTPQIL